MDEKGKVKKELLKKEPYSITGLNIAKNRKYISISDYRRTLEDVDLYKASIYNTNGDLIFYIDLPIPYVHVSPNGKYVVGSNDLYSNDRVSTPDK